MITVLLADDHELFLNNLHSLLERADDIQIVGMALNGEEAVAQARLHCPNVAVIDISMPFMEGVQVVKELCAVCPQTRALMLSISDHSEYIRRALKEGAMGYVLKELVGDDLLAAIHAVHQGNRYFSQRIAETAKQYIK
jgi:DNA-binding NarL/FixJ family response regulator